LGFGFARTELYQLISRSASGVGVPTSNVSAQSATIGLSFGLSLSFLSLAGSAR